MKNIVKKPLAVIATALAAVMTLGCTGCAKVPGPGEVIVYLPSVPETDVSAFSYYYDSDYYGMVIDYYYNESPQVKIPDTIEGYPVTGVVMPYCQKNLTHLILPETVKYINLSRETKKGLEYINVPRDMTCVDGYDHCSRLESIVISDGATMIDEKAFEYCTSLTNITISDNVTKIGESAFGYCTGITSVTIPDSVTSIGKFTFNDCTSLTSVTIPDSVTEIGTYAFTGCTNLTSVTIPHGVTEISHGTFKGCESLTSITIPDGVTKIGSSAFEGCTNLTNITIPDSVTEIFIDTFYKCPNIKATYKGKTYDYQHMNLSYLREENLYNAINYD